MEQYLQVGVITSTHGLKGEVKVYPTTDSADRFLELSEVYLDTKTGLMKIHITGVRFFKQFVIVGFREFPSINDIEKYKGCSLYVDREHGAALSEDEYYIADLIGMNVVLEDGSSFGTLKDVYETGANDVYIIESPKYGEVMVPAIADCILDVNIRDNLMKIHLLPGLVD